MIIDKSLAVVNLLLVYFLIITIMFLPLNETLLFFSAEVEKMLEKEDVSLINENEMEIDSLWVLGYFAILHFYIYDVSAFHMVKFEMKV